MAKAKSMREIKKDALRALIGTALEQSLTAEFDMEQFTDCALISGSTACRYLREIDGEGEFQILQTAKRNMPWVLARVPKPKPLTLFEVFAAEEKKQETKPLLPVKLEEAEGEDEVPDPFVPSTHEERVEFLLARLIDEVINMRRTLERSAINAADIIESAIERNTTRYKDNLERSTAAMAGVATEVRSLVKMWS
jgi:hypothetical protein